MSVIVAEGVVVVSADADGVTGDVVNALRRGDNDVRRQGRRTGDGWVDNFKGSFLGNALADIAGNVVNFVGSAISTGVTAAWDLAWDSIDIASGLQEADTALNAVFGGSKGVIDSFAEGAARAIGQSELAAKKAAQTFGGYGSAAGLAGEANANFATDLVSLGSDLASFYDSTPEEAIEALGSALRGEAEPLRRFNVLLDDQRLRQEAMELGIYDGNGALTSQQKILAANRAIFEDTGVAQGDFAKTSESLANQQRSLAGQFEDVKGKLGEALLPALTELMTFANDDLVPILDELVEKVGPALADALSESGPAFIELLGEIAPHIPGIVEGIGEFVLWMIELIGKLELGAEQIAGFFDVASEKLELGAEQWGGFFGAVGGFFQGFSDKLTLGQDQVFTFFGNVGDRFAQGGEQWGSFFAGVGGWLGDMGGRFGTGGQQIGSFFGTVGEKFATGWSQISSFFGNVGGAIGHGIGEFGRFAGEVGANIGRAVQWVADLPGRVLGALGNVGGILVSAGRSLVQGFLDGLTSMWGKITDTVGGVVDFIAGFFPNSPAKRGPLSGAGWTNLKRSGGAIMDQLGIGMRENAPAVPFDLLGLGGAATRPVGYGGPIGLGGGYGSTGPASTHPTAPINVTVNEARDPLGSAGRVAAELRKWKGR